MTDELKKINWNDLNKMLRHLRCMNNSVSLELNNWIVDNHPIEAQLQKRVDELEGLYNKAREDAIHCIKENTALKAELEEFARGIVAYIAIENEYIKQKKPSKIFLDATEKARETLYDWQERVNDPLPPPPEQEGEA